MCYQLRSWLHFFGFVGNLRMNKHKILGNPLCSRLMNHQKLNRELFWTRVSPPKFKPNSMDWKNLFKFTVNFFCTHIFFNFRKLSTFCLWNLLSEPIVSIIQSNWFNFAESEEQFEHMKNYCDGIRCKEDWFSKFFISIFFSKSPYFLVDFGSDQIIFNSIINMFLQVKYFSFVFGNRLTKSVSKFVPKSPNVFYPCIICLFYNFPTFVITLSVWRCFQNRFNHIFLDNTIKLPISQ